MIELPTPTFAVLETIARRLGDGPSACAAEILTATLEHYATDPEPEG